MSGGFIMKFKKYIPEIIVIFTVPFIIFFGISVAKHSASPKANVYEGSSYLDSMESQDVKNVENNIENGSSASGETSGTDETNPVTEPATTVAEETTATPTEPATNPGGVVGGNDRCYNPYAFDQAKADAASAAVQSGQSSFKELFANTLFVGDSIMTGFDDYRIVNSGNVIAHVGAFLNKHLPENMDAIVNYNPKVLVLHYGLNEIEVNQSFLETFITNYTSDIKELKQKLPDCKIIVVGLMPVQQSAIDREARFGRVDAYNDRIRQMCVEQGVAYDEDASVFKAHQDLYAADGIHFAKGLYTAWMNEFVKEMGIY